MMGAVGLNHVARGTVPKAAGLCLAALLLATCLGAEPSEALALWPQSAPGDAGELGPEHDTTKPTDQKIAGQPVIRLGNVARPTLTVYPAPKATATGAAVVICPGGGYHILAMDLEGTEVAQWLNSLGITGVVLKYRVPARPNRPRHAAPLQDAQRAFGLVRQHASAWGLDPKRIGILGFSAGAHLAAALSTHFEQRDYDPIDAADQLSCRPDFVVLVYPGYLSSDRQGTNVAPELQVTAQTPPTFLVQTEDDPVGVEGSLAYFGVLRKAKVPAEMHLYPKGGHGYGLRPSTLRVTSWPTRVAEWMVDLQVLTAPASR